MPNPIKKLQANFEEKAKLKEKEIEKKKAELLETIAMPKEFYALKKNSLLYSRYYKRY